MHNQAFVKWVRTRYWASFCTRDGLAAAAGQSRGALESALARAADDLPWPASLAFQNRNPPGPFLDVRRRPRAVVRRFTGAGPATRVVCLCTATTLRLDILCQAAPRRGAAAVASPPSAEAEALWSGDFETLNAWRARCGARAFDNWARRTGPRPGSLFDNDCVLVALTPLRAGGSFAGGAFSRALRDPLAPVTARPSSPRIFLEGAFYYLAVDAQGRLIQACFDPWDGGFFWPCWRSGATALARPLDGGWAVTLTLPLANLEPLAVSGTLWGVDLFRLPTTPSGAPAPLRRALKPLFLRPRGHALGEQRFLSSIEERGPLRGPRHAYIASVHPPVELVQPRPLPAGRVPRLVPAPRAARRALDDSLWREAAPLALSWQDQTGAAAAQPATARLVHDGRFLYLRIDCPRPGGHPLRVVTRAAERALYGTGDRRVHYLERREAFGLDWGDHVALLLAPGRPGADIFHGGHYLVLINSRGRTLTRYYDPSGAPSTFDAFSPWRPALDVRVSHTPRVWIARLALPFAELHAASGLTACWRANFAQVRSLPGDTPPAETLAWAPMYGRRRLLERCGRLDFEGWTRHAGNRRRKFAFVPDVDPRPAPPPPAATAARDALFGMAFATPCCGCAVGGRGTILRTADGGTSWTVIPSGTDAVLQAVAFGDAHHGCAVGGVRRDQRHDIGASAGVILATEDGGVTWRTALGECGAHLYGVSFGDARTVYAAGEYGTVWKSLNRGRTWRPCAATGTPRWLFALHAIDAAHVVAVGEEGAIIVTRDGGVTWRTASAPLFAAPYGFSATLRAVHFADRRHGWAAGDRGVLLRTRDGGGTWESCTLPLEAGARDAFAIRAVRFRTPREGWLAGAPGSAMFRTADGGTTWHREPCDTALGLHALHLLPDGAAWAAGECGMRLRRVPGGDRWRHAGGGESLPGLLYVTPHAHHLDAIPWPALLQRHTLFFAGGKRDLAPHNLTGEGSPQNLQAAALRYGFRALRCFADLPGDRRREPHRIHQVYQAWQGVEILERRLVAVIRSLRPATVIAEWAILAEGYWAMDVALMARALTRAFASAADPAAFPELAALGLAPWRAGTLFIHHLGWPADLYRVHHRRDWTLRARGTDPVPSLGITLGEARFRAACEWGSLLDRARLKRAADYRRATSVAHFHRATDAPRKETPA